MCGLEIFTVINEVLSPHSLISTVISINRTVYHNMRGSLLIKNVLFQFLELAQNTSVLFMTIRALWPEQYDELTKQWVIKKRLSSHGRELEHNNNQHT